MNTNDLLANLTQALAPHFPEWTLLLHSECLANFTRSDGASFFLELDTCKRPPRVAIHGQYLPNCRIRGDSHITISTGRSPESIAKDIHSRFLPSYLSIYVEQHKEQQKVEEQKALDAQALSQLAAILETRPRNGTIYSAHANISVKGGGQIAQMKLSAIPIQTAKAICHLLNSIE